MTDEQFKQMCPHMQKIVEEMRALSVTMESCACCDAININCASCGVEVVGVRSTETLREQRPSGARSLHGGH